MPSPITYHRIGTDPAEPVRWGGRQRPAEAGPTRSWHGHAVAAGWPAESAQTRWRAEAAATRRRLRRRVEMMTRMSQEVFVFDVL